MSCAFPRARLNASGNPAMGRSTAKLAVELSMANPIWLVGSMRTVFRPPQKRRKVQTPDKPIRAIHEWSGPFIGGEHGGAHGLHQYRGEPCIHWEGHRERSMPKARQQTRITAEHKRSDQSLAPSGATREPIPRAGSVELATSRTGCGRPFMATGRREISRYAQTQDFTH